MTMFRHISVVLVLVASATLAMACSSGSFIGGPDSGSEVDGSPLPDGGPGPGLDPDASPRDAEVTGPTAGTYFGACFSQLSAGRTDRVLRFYTETRFVSSAGGVALTLKITPLRLPPTATNPETGTFGAAAKSGSTFTAEAAVDSKGVFTASFGTVNVPGDSNPISGRETIILNTVFKGRFTDPKKFCAQLSGNVTQPTQNQLEPGANTCLFFEANEGVPYIDPPLQDYVCNVN